MYSEGLLDENGDKYYKYSYYLGVFTLVARETFLAEGENCTLDIEFITEHTSDIFSDISSDMTWLDSQIIMTNTGTESLYWHITFALPSDNVELIALSSRQDAYVVALHEDKQANRVSMKPAYSALYRWDVGLAPEETRRVLLTGQYQGEAFLLQNFSCVSLGAPLPAGALRLPPSSPLGPIPPSASKDNPASGPVGPVGPVGASQPEAVDKP